MFTRRLFVRTALAALATGTVLPLVSTLGSTRPTEESPPVAEAFSREEPQTSDALSEQPPEVVNMLAEPPSVALMPARQPLFEPFWVVTELPTKLWPTMTEVDTAVGKAEPGRVFRVDAPQEDFRLFVWDPHENRHVYIGLEAVGTTAPPFWDSFADNGRWLNVTLSGPQHVSAMQGDLEVRRELISAGIERRTKPGFYRIKYRVESETMDSRTVPDATRTYLLKDVLYTQYFDDEGSAIHYNWWATTWGAPGSQGCLGMKLEGAKFMWEWANINTPLVVHY
jgi:hypothetical protein